MRCIIFISFITLLLSLESCDSNNPDLSGIWVSEDILIQNNIIEVRDDIWIFHPLTISKLRCEIEGNNLRFEYVSPRLYNEDYKEFKMTFRLKQDTLILNSEFQGKVVYVRRKNEALSDFIIAKTKKDIALPYVKHDGFVNYNSETSIFVSKEDFNNRTFYSDKKVWNFEDLAPLLLRKSDPDRLGMMVNQVNAYYDKETPYSYVLAMQTEMRKANKLLVNYILNEKDHHIEEDSVTMSINALSVKLPPYNGLDTVHEIPIPPAPPPPIELSNFDIYNVKIITSNEYVLNGLEVDSTIFINSVDSILKKNSKYIFVYSFENNSNIGEYLNFLKLIRNRVIVARNEYAINQLNSNYYVLDSVITSEKDYNTYRKIKMKIPIRLISKEVLEEEL